MLDVRKAKAIERKVKLTRPSQGLEDSEWVVRVTAPGVSVRRLGETRRICMSWRELLSCFVMYGKKNS
jgi:hypothetical protein